MAQILLVDDDELLRPMIRLVLERAGYRVREARNGNDAMRQFAQDQGDLVITDLIMPEKEGLALILEMRRINRKLKIIAMSGGGRVSSKDYLEVAAKFGAAQVLNKPFSNQELLNAVHQVLEGGMAPVIPKSMIS